MRIPSEAAIRSTIKTGSVFYYVEDGFNSNQPHFFIVLNVDPLTDAALILVCSSSRVETVKRRRRGEPQETLVEIAPAEYSDFRVNSIVDCNHFYQETIPELVQKRSEGKLLLKQEMEASITEKMRQGMLVSRLIPRNIKALL